MRLRHVAIGNLRRRSSRAAFLVAGLLIGIATVVSLLTLSRALTVQAQNQLETYGANIVVAPRTDDLSLSYGGVAVGGVAGSGVSVGEGVSEGVGVRTGPGVSDGVRVMVGSGVAVRVGVGVGSMALITLWCM